MSSTETTPDTAEIDASVTSGIRTVLGASGVVSLVVGILILVFPLKTAVVLAGFIAVYAALAGVVNLAVGVFSRALGAWPRIGYSILGIIFLAAAVFALANLRATAASLAMIVAIMIGIVWIVEGLAGFTMIRRSPSKGWTVIYSVLSIIAGIVLITSPMWGAALLWLFLGISLVVLGIAQIIRAFRFGSS